MARKFKFRLDPVLRLRKRAFEEKQRVVAARLQAIGEERAAIEEIQAKLRENETAARAAQATGMIDVACLAGFRSHAMLLHQRVGECDERLAAHEVELERERQEMVEASVRLKAMEKLRERRHARYVEEEQRNESAQQNELAVQTYGRRQVAATERRNMTP